METTTEPSYFLAEGVPGSGDAPEYFKSDKYKTVSDQAKAYVDLERAHGEMANKFKNFTGAPDQYEIAPPEGVTLNGDDPLLQSAMQWGKENNLNQDAFNSLIGLYSQIEASKAKASEDAYEEQIAQIENFNSRSQNINQFLKANQMEALADVVTSKDQLEQLEKLLDMAGSPSINPDAEGNSVPTEEEINKLMFEKDEHGQVIYNRSPERREQVRKLIERRVGAGQYQQIVA